MGINKSIALPALAVLMLGLGVTVSGYASAAGKSTTCEIIGTANGGMLSIQGVVHASAPVSGSYQMQVNGQGPGGSSDSSQGGDFTASAGDAVTLGQMMVSNGGGTYDVTLSLDANGSTIRCQNRFGAQT